MGIGRSRQAHGGDPSSDRRPGPADKAPKAGFELRSWVVIAQNVVGLVLSVPVLVDAVLLSAHDGDSCATFMDKPSVSIGALLMLVSLLGICLGVASHGKEAGKRAWAQLVLLFCLVVLLFCFAIFSLEITNEDLAHHVTAPDGRIVTEYRLYEYPKWMRHQIERPSKWAQIKSCLISGSVCAGVVATAANLSPIQGGCCRPPSACNFTSVGLLQTEMQAFPATGEGKVPNPGQAAPPNTSETSRDLAPHVLSSGSSSAAAAGSTKEEALSEIIRAYTHDCRNWSNDPATLCFDCDTCKAGLIQSSMDHWHNSGTLYVVLVMVMIVQYALFACFGFKEFAGDKG